MKVESGNEVIVVGAGAAGVMAAIFAAREGARVRLIERTADGGRKILISGGGRCNVLPSQLAVERFVTDSPAHIMRGLLRSWPLIQQTEFFENALGIPLALEADTGKLFPTSNRARVVRDTLVEHARARNVRLDFNMSVSGLEPGRTGWIVQTSDGAITAARVILATGGLSVPTTGSDGAGLRIAESLGHRVNPVYPALTPLLAEPAVHADLSGVSLRVRIRARTGTKRVETTGGFLFTHRGYSGPAVLDISHVAVRDAQAAIRIQWAEIDRKYWERRLGAPEGLVNTVVSSHVQRRLAARLLEESGIPRERRTSELRSAERAALLDRLSGYALPWTGHEGFKKAEVTGGGVALDEVDPRTLESRKQKGLFLCGEMLDAFGPIGGHNFAWAWATGRLAGIGAAR